MKPWKLTRKAQKDFAGIVLYTVDTWGKQQAERYTAQLLETFDLLARKPGVGRSCEDLSPALRRFEQGKHTIFYRPERNRILISRILHQSQLPTSPQFTNT